MISFDFRMSRLELRHLSAAVALAEIGGFGRAAAALGMAQPLFSTLIARVEAAAGDRLFDRRPSVRLTASGEALIPRLRAALDEAGRGFEAVKRLQRGETGALSIGLPTWLLATFVPESIERYRRRRPDVELRLHDVSSASQLRMLLAGELDLAFIRAPAVDQQDVVSEVLFTERFCAVLPPGHRLAQRPEVALADLQGESFIAFPRANAPALRDQIDRLLAASGLRADVAQETQEWLTMLALVKIGLGVSIAPASLRRLWPADTAFVPLAEPQAVSTVHVCRRPDAGATATDFLADLRRARDAAEGPQATPAP